VVVTDKSIADTRIVLQAQWARWTREGSSRFSDPDLTKHGMLVEAKIKDEIVIQVLCFSHKYVREREFVVRNFEVCQCSRPVNDTQSLRDEKERLHMALLSAIERLHQYDILPPKSPPPRAFNATVPFIDTRISTPAYFSVMQASVRSTKKEPFFSQSSIYMESKDSEKLRQRSAAMARRLLVEAQKGAKSIARQAPPPPVARDEADAAPAPVAAAAVSVCVWFFTLLSLST